jgi:RNA polymerase sigma factor (sigma-70 family)
VRGWGTLVGAGADGFGDAQLLERFLAGRDAAAFALIVQRHGPLVFGLCRRLLRRRQDAEDVFQATFLVLLRKAGTIARPESLGSWLYGVAYRLARHAQAVARREAAAEVLADPPAPAGTPEVVWRELRPILDEEIARLPEKYQAAFVLCHVEGKTNAEAARLLGCPPGTVLSRLARARAHLRVRLSRRGITLPTASLAALLTHESLTAAVAPRLNALALQAAGFPHGSGVAPRVAALADHGVQAMRWTRLKLLVAGVAVVALLGTASAFALHHALASNPDPAPPSAGPAKQPPAPKGKVAAQQGPPAGKKPPPGKAPADDKTPQTAKSTRTVWQGKTNPAGVPLEMRLIVKRGTYPLDLQGRTEEQFLKEAAKYGGGGLDSPPPVELALEFCNTGRREVELTIGGDQGNAAFDLRGPGAVLSWANRGDKRRFEPGERVRLRPGQKFTLPVQQLTYTAEGKWFRPYWARQGDYTLTAHYACLVAPAPAGSLAMGEGYGAVLLTSGPVTLTITGPRVTGGK